METDVKSYYNYKNRPIRKAVCCSLDEVIPRTENLMLMSVISGPDYSIESPKDSLLWMEVTSAITKKQMDVPQMKVAEASE